MTAVPRAAGGMRIAYTGGGTGGHIYPALAIDAAWRAAAPEPPPQRRYLGHRGGLEATLVTEMPLTFVSGAALQRRFSIATLLTVGRNVAGVTGAAFALLRFAPALVVATGGYVCFPVVVAARLLRSLRLLNCRITLLEMNAEPGLTNRLLAPLVDEVWITYRASRRFFGRKAVLTGAPVRASLRARRDRASARLALGLDPQRTTVVVMGGSQGARTINDTVAALCGSTLLPPDWQVFHICGERDLALMRERYARVSTERRVRLEPYVADPADAYAAADIVVARAGASTLAELATTATPAILVPYPYAADDHQARNAAEFAAGGAAAIVPDADLSPSLLATLLLACLNPVAAARMRVAAAALAPPDAAANIVARITALLASRVADSASPNEVARGPRQAR